MEKRKLKLSAIIAALTLGTACLVGGTITTLSANAGTETNVTQTQASNTPQKRNSAYIYIQDDDTHEFDYARFDKIDYKALTHLNYAFALVHYGEKKKADGSTEKAGDGSAETEWGKVYLSENDGKALRLAVEKGKAANPDLKIIASIGGGAAGTWCFTQAVSSEEYIQRFADSCKAIIDKYGIDGVDIDWEVPQPNEKDAYTNMIKAVRAKIGTEKILTIAPGANVDFPRKRFDYEKCMPLLDYINIMTYDFHWDPAFFTSALDQSTNGWSEAERGAGKGNSGTEAVLGGYTARRVVEDWISLGVDKSKINFGWHNVQLKFEGYHEYNDWNWGGWPNQFYDANDFAFVKNAYKDVDANNDGTMDHGGINWLQSEVKDSKGNVIAEPTHAERARYVLKDKTFQSTGEITKEDGTKENVTRKFKFEEEYDKGAAYWTIIAYELDAQNNKIPVKKDGAEVGKKKYFVRYYQDKRSMAARTNFVNEMDIGGMFMWRYDADTRCELIKAAAMGLDPDVAMIAKDARDKADSEKAQAIADENAALVAKEQAESDKDIANIAKTQAETAKANAEAEKAQAIADKTAAETEKVQAIADKTAAETAKTTAETAKTAAETAKTEAETAKATAETAKKEAEDKLAVAEKAKKEAEDKLAAKKGCGSSIGGVGTAIGASVALLLSMGFVVILKLRAKKSKEE